MFKHPIIIPAKQHITKLLIMEVHIRTLHGGIQQMVVFLRTKYWIMGWKSAVRKCIHNCKVFIAAFWRFVARRGHCAHMISDNGTNFVGAAKELKDLFTKAMNNVTREVAELLANNGTTWHFNHQECIHMEAYGRLVFSRLKDTLRETIRTPNWLMKKWPHF